MKNYIFSIMVALSLVGWCCLPAPEDSSCASYKDYDVDFYDEYDCPLGCDFEGVTDSVKAKIKAFEGCNLIAIQDSGNLWRIGYGHVANVHEGDIITKAYANSLFERDLRHLCDRVNAWDICHTQSEFDAIVSLVYNIGEGAFLSSQLKREIEDGSRPSRIRKEFMRWVHANGVPLNGLKERREWESRLFLEY